jgi:ribonuclease VapC
MIVDTSAILAILNDEPERRQFTEAIEASDECLMSTASFVEASLVLEAMRGYEGLRDLDLLLAKAGVEFVPVDLEQAHVARKAFRIFGKGRHPAKLNFGDCFSYALAIATHSRLLFKGNDFSQTDVIPAV